METNWGDTPSATLKQETCFKYDMDKTCHWFNAIKNPSIIYKTLTQTDGDELFNIVVLGLMSSNLIFDVYKPNKTDQKY